ncbi:hypothetical protein BSPP4475_07985 [Brevibacillus aydinogluensis]|uniref:Uncharacterized protein n=1 Tax=Brevibacillus aydinogluensis TaxID=927786 RepID=A0AA48M6N8_9BACL|nr:hypothetical protein BSPP4475_07985 [Brevibacillus aydinogluensis]
MLSISDRLPLNARCAYNRIVKVGSHHCRPGRFKQIEASHVAEAIRYRALDGITVVKVQL